MRPEFTVHIDPLEPEMVTRLAAAVKGLNGEPRTGSADTRDAEVLVTQWSRFSTLENYKKSLLESPSVVLYLEKDPGPVNDLLRSRVFGVFDDDIGEEDLKELLRAALEDYRYRQDLVKKQEDVRDRYIELVTVVRLNLELGLELDVEKVLERIVRQISTELGFAIVSIMLLDQSGRNLRIRASKGLSDRIRNSTEVPIGKGVAGWVAESGEPLLVRDIETHPQLKKLRSHGRYSSKSLISVPLKVGERIIGVLNANNREGRAELTEHDLRLLSLYASQASVKIERARLYRDVEKQADELKKAYEKLQALDTIKSDFITNVSHEFRTPITVILGYLELLKAGLSDDGQIKKVDIAMSSSYRLARLVDDSTDILRLESDTMPFVFKTVKINTFVEKVVQKYSSRFADKGVVLSVNVPDDIPPVFMDAGRMSKVFDKLLDNSLKFTPPGGHAAISCSVLSEGEVTISMEDTGPGIPFGEKERVFERFEQGGDIMTSKPEGTGLGLPIARAIIERHGGRLWLDEDYRDGCRILFTLPRGTQGAPAGEGSGE
jgi:signal transduction histidine kinase